jgi:CHAD domain-containing protein
MPFCFKRRETVPKAVRRLAAERIEAALKSLREYRRARAIHGVRKDIKKVRAVLRLARERIPKKAYRRQNDRLREAAECLAPTRDAYVKGAALKKLREHFQGEFDRNTFRGVRKQMEGDLVHAEHQFARKKSVRKVKALLKRIPKELDSLTFDAKGWKAIAPGLKTVYARGREAYLSARREPSSEHLHDWRKRVKDLWYQIRVLRPIAPRAMGALSEQLKTLSEQLGDDHDLDLLRQSVMPGTQAQGELFESNVLIGMIEERRSQLQRDALKLGEQAYAESPMHFCRRLAEHWEAWRNGRKNAVL